MAKGLCKRQQGWLRHPRRPLHPCPPHYARHRLPNTSRGRYTPRLVGISRSKDLSSFLYSQRLRSKAIFRYASSALSLTRRPTLWPLIRRSARPPNSRSLALPLGVLLPSPIALRGSVARVSLSSPPFHRQLRANRTLLPRWAPRLANGQSRGARPALPTTPSPEPFLNYSEGARQLASDGGAFVTPYQTSVVVI
jgi:hypothetical protein